MFSTNSFDPNSKGTVGTNFIDINFNILFLYFILKK